MVKYKIIFTKSSFKELDSIGLKDAHRITRLIFELGKNPRPPGSEKLTGAPLYRIRQGDYRIVYFINDSEHIIDIIKIGHRREVYR